MAAELVGAVLKLRGMNPTEKLVLLSLAYHCNTKTGRCDPSIPLVGEETEITERQVYRILSRLVAKRLLVRRSGGGAGHRNQYSFPPSLLGRGQAGLWDENPDAHATLMAEKTLTSASLQTLTPMSGGDDTHVRGKGKERERKGSIPYGGLDAPAAYRQALADLPKNGNKQGQVAVLINFTRAHCPALANPGRLAAFVKSNEAPDVLHAIWQAAVNAKANPLDYVYGTLRRKHGPPPPSASGDLGWEKASRQGRGHPKGEE